MCGQGGAVLGGICRCNGGKTDAFAASELGRTTVASPVKGDDEVVAALASA